MLMRKRRKLQEGAAGRGSGTAEQLGPQGGHIAALRPSTQQELQAAGGLAAPRPLAWRAALARPPVLHAQHRMSPTPPGLVESLSASDVPTSSKHAAAGWGGRLSLRQPQQLSQLMHGGSGFESPGDRRSPAAGERQLCVGLTPRGPDAGSPLATAPQQQQKRAGSGGQRQEDGAMPRFDKAKQAQRHAATINVRAGPLPSAVAAAAAEAVVAVPAPAGSRQQTVRGAAGRSKRHSFAVGIEKPSSRGPLGPEDSLSYPSLRQGHQGVQAQSPAARGARQATAAGGAGTARQETQQQSLQPPRSDASFLAAAPRGAGSPGASRIPLGPSRLSPGPVGSHLPLAGGAAAQASSGLPQAAPSRPYPGTPPRSPAGAGGPASPATRRQMGAAPSPPCSPAGLRLAASPPVRHLHDAKAQRQQAQQRGSPAAWSPLVAAAGECGSAIAVTAGAAQWAEAAQGQHADSGRAVSTPPAQHCCQATCGLAAAGQAAAQARVTLCGGRRVPYCD